MGGGEATSTPTPQSLLGVTPTLPRGGVGSHSALAPPPPLPVARGLPCRSASSGLLKCSTWLRCATPTPPPFCQGHASLSRCIYLFCTTKLLQQLPKTGGGYVGRLPKEACSSCTLVLASPLCVCVCHFFQLLRWSPTHCKLLTCWDPPNFCPFFVKIHTCTLPGLYKDSIFFLLLRPTVL